MLYVEGERAFHLYDQRTGTGCIVGIVRTTPFAPVDFDRTAKKRKLRADYIGPSGNDIRLSEPARGHTRPEAEVDQIR